MASLPPDANYTDLEDELIVQETMLESLDADDDVTREEIQRTIAELEERLRTCGNPQDEGNNAIPYAQSLAGDWTFPADSTAGQNETDFSMPDLPGAFPASQDELRRVAQNGQSSSHGVQNGVQNSVQNGHQNGHAHGLQNGHARHTFGKPSLPAGCKRPFEPSSLDNNEARIKRITPTPSRSQTPLPFTGSQLQSSQSRRSFLLEQQRQREEEHRRKRESELADAALAASLSQYNQSPTAHSPSAAGPSASRSSFHSSANNAQTSPSQWQPIFRPQGYRVKQEHPPSPSPAQSTSSTAYTGLNSYSAPGPSSRPSQSIHSNSYTLAPANHQVKAEVKSETPRSNFTLGSTPRSSSSLQVVDLTGEDDDSDEIIDLTRPSYPMPGSFNGSVNPGMPSNLSPAAQHARALYQARQIQLQRQMSQARSSAQFVYNNGSMSGYSPLQHRAMGRMGAASDETNSFFTNLTQLSNLVNGRDLDPADEQYLRSRYAAVGSSYTPRDDYPVDPETTREDLRKLMENIQPEPEDTIEEEDDIPVDGMTVKLKPYQISGLKWLQKMETGSNKGGILADDMGLGKTVQAIALLVTHKSEDPANKTTLIVAPVALLRQWKEEIENKVRPGSHRLNVFLHHSSAKKKSHRALREFDVVLTTFGTLAAEQKKMDKFLLRKSTDQQATPRDDEKCLFIGPECRWYRVIVDEAQCIKNKTTRTAKASYQVLARSRFCLTGTPMMNGVEELYSLVHFLRIKPYSDWQKFNMDFVRPLKNNNEQGRAMAMQKLQALLKAILLRRNKQTKINGRPILTLPERVIEQTHAVFSDDEKEFYLALEGQQQIEFNKYLKAGTVGRSYAHILLLLLRLRQACCHPHLIKDFGIAAAADITEDAMDDLCRSLSDQVIDRIKATEGNFECPVCFDAVENPAIFVPCGHDTCSECFTRIADPVNAVANGDENGRTAKCPECRGPINTKSVVDYACFKRIHMPEPEAGAVEREEQQDPAEAETDSEMDSDSDDSDSDSSEDSEDEDDKTLGGFIVKDDVDSQASTEPESESESNGEIPIVTGSDVQKAKDKKKKAKLFKAKATASSSASSSKKPKKSKKAKGKEKKKVKKSNYTLSELKRLAGSSKKHKKQYMDKVGKDYIPSAKIEKTMEIIKDIIDNEEDQEKIIIFSQWTSLLDLLEIDIDRHGYGYRRYDGSMNAKLRGDAVDDFKNKDRVRMMLVSLKAGNAGLNLNVASQVIILDPFWNPYIEEQAIDRAHRLGQMRPVHVHRILVPETVEDRILALQEKKRAVISEALDEKASKGVSRLSPQELAYLFGINRNMDDPLVVRGR